MRRIFTTLSYIIMMSISCHALQPYKPEYGLQFKLNNYQFKEYELSFILNKNSLPTFISCSQGLFYIDKDQKQKLKSTDIMSYKKPYINFYGINVGCHNSHTILQAKNLWRNFTFGGNSQNVRASSEALTTPLFSNDFSYLTLPILDNFSDLFLLKSSKIILKETDANLITCIYTQFRKFCSAKDLLSGVKINKSEMFYVGIVNNDVNIWVNYGINLEKGVLEAWASEDFLSVK